MFSFQAAPQPSGFACRGCGGALPQKPTYPPNHVRCGACDHPHWYPPRIYQDLPFLIPAAEVGELKGAMQAEVLGEMVQSLISVGALDEACRDSIVSDLVHRESLSSTGIGHGVAVPHLRLPHVEQPTGLIAYSKGGIEYASQDGGLVHVFILLFTNEREHATHLRGLERITRHLRRALALSVGL